MADGPVWVLLEVGNSRAVRNCIAEKKSSFLYDNIPGRGLQGFRTTWTRAARGRLPPRRSPMTVGSRRGRASPAGAQHRQIAPLVRLQHLLGDNAVPAARGPGRRPPGGAAS